MFEESRLCECCAGAESKLCSELNPKHQKVNEFTGLRATLGDAAATAERERRRRLPQQSPLRDFLHRGNAMQRGRQVTTSEAQGGLSEVFHLPRGLGAS